MPEKLRKLIERRILVLRIVLCGILISTAVIFGIGSYIILFEAETHIEMSFYSSLKTQIKMLTVNSVEEKANAMDFMSNFVGMQCPELEDWPNCIVDPESYLNVAIPLMNITESRTISMAPVLNTTQVSGFEDYFYNTYMATYDSYFTSLGYPNVGSTGGIHGVYNLDDNGVAYHDTVGYTEGEYPVLVPVAMTGNLASHASSIMFNVYSSATRVSAIDCAITCALNNAGNCTAISNVFQLNTENEERPAALLVHPITPQNRSDQVVGVVFIVHNWDSVLSNLLPDYVSGIDVVLFTDEANVVGNSKWTFKIHNGKANYADSGDKHDRDYDNTKATFQLTNFTGAVNYHISIYSTPAYSKLYRTNLPIIVSVCSSMVMLIVIVVFILYDRFINRNARDKELILETKRLFVRFISHEIRTPLNTVHLGLTVLRDEMQTVFQNHGDVINPDVVTEMKSWMSLISDVEDSSDNAVVVLNDLINYDKIMMGTLTIELSPVPIWNIITHSLNPFFVQAKQKRILLSVVTDIHKMNVTPAAKRVMSGLKGMVDEVKFPQVIKNLVTNALKYTPSGGSVTVKVWWDESNATNPDLDTEHYIPAGNIVVSVIDTGAGLTEDQMSHLFQEGVEFNSSVLQAGSGSGLGLYISRGLMSLHKGTLTAESEGLNKGSTFTITLPIFKEINDNDSITVDNIDKASDVSKVSKSATSAAATPVAAINTKDSTCRILVVDDSIPTRKVMIRLLTNAGYECDAAENGVDAVNKVKLCSASNMYACILMDFEMPMMNGPEATSALRELGYTMPIVGVTGNVMSADSDLFLQKGASSVLHKPVTLTKLQNAISTSSQFILEEETSATSRALKLKRILVVDKNDVTRSYLCRLLDSAGYECDSVCSSEECIDTITRCDPEKMFQILLIDFEFAEENEAEIIQNLMELGVAIPYIGISREQGGVDKFSNLGAMSTVLEPITIHKLEAAIKEVERKTSPSREISTKSGI